jgi:thioredoxin-related protein
MKPELAQFGSKSPIPVVEVDLDLQSSPEYRKYSSKMTSRSIPFTVLLDAKGDAILQLTGYQSSGDLVKATQKYLK